MSDQKRNTVVVGKTSPGKTTTANELLTLCSQPSRFRFEGEPRDPSHTFVVGPTSAGMSPYTEFQRIKAGGK